MKLGPVAVSSSKPSYVVVIRAICGTTNAVTAAPTITPDPAGESPSANPGTAATERAAPTSARFDIVTVVSSRATGWLGVNEANGNGNTNRRRPEAHVVPTLVSGCAIDAPLHGVPAATTAATGEPSSDIEASASPSSRQGPERRRRRPC